MLPVFDETYVNGGQLFYAKFRAKLLPYGFFNRFAFRNI